MIRDAVAIQLSIAERVELEKLRKENQELKADRDLLKKWAANLAAAAERCGLKVLPSTKTRLASLIRSSKRI